jgi:hypothetical protein
VIITAARSEQKLMETHNVQLPRQTVSIVLNDIDLVATNILSIYHPVMLSQYQPLKAVGDGNCLYRAVSKSLTGSEKHHKLLRLQTLLELILNERHYCTDKKRTSFLGDSRIVNSDYNTLILDTVKLNSFSELAHIYALSAVIGEPIKSYYPPQLHSEYSSEPMTRRVIGRGVKDGPAKVTIMWSMMAKPTSLTEFRPNHFVPLILKEISNTCETNTYENFIDLESTQTDKIETENQTKKCHKTKANVDTISLKDGRYKCTPIEINSIPQNANVVEAATNINDFDCVHDYESDSDDGLGRGDSRVDVAGLLDSDVSDDQKDSVSQVDHVGTDTTFDRSVAGESDTCSEVGSELGVDSVGDDYQHNRSLQCDVDNESEGSVSLSESGCVAGRIVKNDKDANSQVSSIDPSLTGTIEGFLDTSVIIELLEKNTNGLTKIPSGRKENQYFIVENSINLDKRTKQKKSSFSDDCGVWNTSAGATPKTIYFKANGDLTVIFYKDGQYCKKRQIQRKTVYEPMSPQPSENEIVVVHRYYTTLKADKNYKKKVSCLGSGSSVRPLALVEYIGKFPGLIPHGNASKPTEYLRTPDYVMDVTSDSTFSVVRLSG